MCLILDLKSESVNFLCLINLNLFFWVQYLVLRILTTAIALWKSDSKSISWRQDIGTWAQLRTQVFFLFKNKDLLLGAVTASICHIWRRHCRTSLEVPESPESPRRISVTCLDKYLDIWKNQYLNICSQDSHDFYDLPGQIFEQYPNMALSSVQIEVSDFTDDFDNSKISTKISQYSSLHLI